MAGESEGIVLSKVPLSNNTSSRKIEHVAEYLNDQLIERMKGEEFGLQLDEATDRNKYTHLNYCIRFLVGIKIKVFLQEQRFKTCLRFLIPL